MNRFSMTQAVIALDGEVAEVSAENACWGESPPTAAEVGTQLRRILGTPEFAASTRSARFLTYIVERTLAGEARLLKQYSIATAALGRDSSFDPDRDPLVRLEAGKLRRNLVCPLPRYQPVSQSPAALASPWADRSGA